MGGKCTLPEVTKGGWVPEVEKGTPLKFSPHFQSPFCKEKDTEGDVADEQFYS